MKAAQTKIFIIALALSMVGCDREKLPAPFEQPSKATAQSQPTAATRPTTQELVDGERHTITLGRLPLTMNVPQSWKIDSSDGAIQSIVGFSPHGPVKISLSDISTPFSDTTLPLADKGLAKRAAESKGKMEVKPLRPLGATAKVREQRERVADAPIMRGGHSVTTDVMDWSVDVYVRMDKTYMQYSLHFDSLPLKQYEQDKDFFEKIIATLQYDATKGAAH